jgi:hypothetical protein
MQVWGYVRSGVGYVQKNKDAADNADAKLKKGTKVRRGSVMEERKREGRLPLYAIVTCQLVHQKRSMRYDHQGQRNECGVI